MTEKNAPADPLDETIDPVHMADARAVSLAVAAAKSASFDGCHKIYLYTDETDSQEAETVYGHSPERFLHIHAGEESRSQARRIILRWLSISCGLRMVQLVLTDEEGTEFIDVIEQRFAE